MSFFNVLCDFINRVIFVVRGLPDWGKLIVVMVTTWKIHVSLQLMHIRFHSIIVQSIVLQELCQNYFLSIA